MFEIKLNEHELNLILPLLEEGVYEQYHPLTLCQIDEDLCECQCEENNRIFSDHDIWNLDHDAFEFRWEKCMQNCPYFQKKCEEERAIKSLIDKIKTCNNDHIIKEI